MPPTAPGRSPKGGRLAILDRAVGAILGMACGDALGAPYEFGPPLGDDAIVAMGGGGAFAWEPGEWTDDTSMAVPILRAVAEGRDPLDESAQDGIVAEWVAWGNAAPDVGQQTAAVLTGLQPTAAAARVAAKAVHEARGKSGGNGSLMRTSPVALAYLGDDHPERVARAARALSDLTHFDSAAGDACVIWSVAIWDAVREGRVTLSHGLDALPSESRDRWAALVEDAEHRAPRDFTHNGWVVEAFQAAWSAITGAGVACNAEPTAAQARDAIERAVRGGRDADTVAAITGSLGGAAVGAEALPAEWRDVLHGWPGLGSEWLASLATRAVTGGR